MNKLNENTENITSALEHFKNIFKMLFKKQYSASFRSLSEFLKALFLKLKMLYLIHLKGQYVEIKGKRIPKTLLAVLAVIFLYLISPMSFLFSNNTQIDTQKTENNVYNKDGIRIHSMRKCDFAACGVLEYRGTQDLEKVRITVTFYNQAGQPTYEGNAETLQLAPNSRMEFTIPCDEDFGYFKLKEVYINPTDEKQ
ncbi:MAG: hypothetical protein IJ218_05450 [Alphaproteobacteria bacterium]|nr:hypothetical protein [Alphaproteobacteria bacterium]